MTPSYSQCPNKDLYQPPGVSDVTAAARHEPPPALDFGWWASNGPTAGYLFRLALEAAPRHDATKSARRIDLQVLGPATAGHYRTETSTAAGSGLELTAVAFAQGRTFATATVLASAHRGPSSEADAQPPRVLPAAVYAPMSTPSPTLPPVTARFEYRPVSVERSTRDFLWISPTDPSLGGHLLVASAIDCWYPAHFMSAIRAHLTGEAVLDQPAPTSLVAASVSFTAPDGSYDEVVDLLLASESSAVADGHFFERSEIWSSRGGLLATADVLRRAEHAEERS